MSQVPLLMRFMNIAEKFDSNFTSRLYVNVLRLTSHALFEQTLTKNDTTALNI